jgi:mono/diheme cytochrome c family protein
MPSFGKILTAKQAEAIRAYIIARAQETAQASQAPQRR